MKQVWHRLKLKVMPDYGSDGISRRGVNCARRVNITSNGLYNNIADVDECDYNNLNNWLCLLTKIQKMLYN